MVVLRLILTLAIHNRHFTLAILHREGRNVTLCTSKLWLISNTNVMIGRRRFLTKAAINTDMSFRAKCVAFLRSSYPNLRYFLWFYAA